MNRTTFNDCVERIHLVLVTESQEYRRYLGATSNTDAVEGSLEADDVFAAILIRDRAKDVGSVEVAAATLASINRALHVVLRRYRASRTQRQDERAETSAAVAVASPAHAGPKRS